MAGDEARERVLRTRLDELPEEQCKFVKLGFEPDELRPVQAGVTVRDTEGQARDNTIASQIAALEARLAQDGLTLTPDERFTDEVNRAGIPGGSNS